MGHAYMAVDIQTPGGKQLGIQSKTGPGMLYNFGELRSINGLKKSRRLEVMPFILGDLKTMKEEPGDPFPENGRIWSGNMGLDAKIGISSNFTVDLTVNPDFGQVESDPSVMNLTAFETFYEEKRPFFLEGLTIFNYNFDDKDLFYSRRIGHSPSLTIDPNDTLYVSLPDKTTILSAIKFSGTTSKGLSVGLIQSVTANEYARLSDQYDNRSTSKVEPLTNYVVARIQKGYKAGNTVIGGMFTSTNRFIEEKNLDSLSNEAYTGGLDILHHWKDKEFYLDAKLLGSYVGGSKEAITILQESSALGSGGHLSFISIFRNNWSFGTNLIFHSQADDSRKLRRGPDMIMPHEITTFGQVRTDPSKKLILSFSYRYEGAGNNSANSYELGPSISVRPFNSLRLSVKADYEKNHDELQYITARNYLTETRYILGTIDQKTLGLTFRADLNLTPEFSIQYYGSPFVSRGTYTEFKRITDPEAGSYNDRFALFTNIQVSDGGFGLDENNDFLSDYYINNPNFNFHQFRSNLVAKWEYRLGSFIYLVWSSDRTGRSSFSHASIGDSYKELRDEFPNNIFLIKLNYWFSL